jgi:hypothetical protein
MKNKYIIGLIAPDGLRFKLCDICLPVRIHQSVKKVPEDWALENHYTPIYK